jgi:hypothetical protein
MITINATTPVASVVCADPLLGITDRFFPQFTAKEALAIGGRWTFGPVLEYSVTPSLAFKDDEYFSLVSSGTNFRVNGDGPSAFPTRASAG